MKLTIGRREYPFEDTPAGREYLKKADVKTELVGVQQNETKRFAYLACKAACENSGEDFDFRWEEFLSLVEQGVVEKSITLSAKMSKPLRKKKTKAKARTKEKTDGAVEDAKASNNE